MSRVDDANPYVDPALREAFRRGWKAWVRGEPRHVDEISEASEKGEGWLDGYESAQGQEASD